MYDKKQWMLEMEIEGLKKGLKPGKFCRMAGISPGTWSGWKKDNANPRVSGLNAIERVIRDYSPSDS